MFTQKYDAPLSDEHKEKGFRFVLLGKQLSHCLQPRRRFFMNIRFQLDVFVHCQATKRTFDNIMLKARGFDIPRARQTEQK